LSIHGMRRRRSADVKSIRRKVALLAAVACLPFAAVAEATPATASTASNGSAACRSGRVALTFDDGPSFYRPRTLRILREARIHATFFEVGMRVAANPQLTLFAAREGHLVLNHTYYHPNLNNLTPAAVRKEVLDTDTVIRAAGVRMRYKGIRPPFLAANDQVRAELARIGYRTVISADVFTNDSNAATTPAEIRSTVFRGLAPNAILLLHDGNIDTPAGASAVRALPSIIRGIKARGYCFGTISRHGKVVAAKRLKPSKNPIPQIINPVPYLPLVEELRGNPPQDPPQPYIIVPSPHAPPAL
jgi:peptidoglycan/xylan/chitin deacetylase (PgdA/CDA1 family)